MSLNNQSTMETTDFDTSDVPLGFKGIVNLKIRSNNIDELSIPVFVIKGNQPGKTITVLGGVHGDEYDGPQAIRDIYTSLEPDELSGTFLGVPHSNIPAFCLGICLAYATDDIPLISGSINLSNVFSLYGIASCVKNITMSVPTSFRPYSRVEPWLKSDLSFILI